MCEIALKNKAWVRENGQGTRGALEIANYGGGWCPFLFELYRILKPHRDRAGEARKGFGMFFSLWC